MNNGSAPPIQPSVVILGGGFAGLNAAMGLRKARCRVTVVDRRNHHVFQPLLYQVATAALSPAQIASPIRRVLGRQINTEVILAEAVRVDPARRVVVLDSGELAYDYLIVGCGVRTSYFGHDDWSGMAPGLKTIEDALDIRSRFLLAFEEAERETDPARREALMTFVVVGGGPTGVEMAGAFAEIARSVIRRDFRHVDTRMAKVILIEARERVLADGFPEDLSARALKDLRGMGVDVRLSTRVTGIEKGPHSSIVRLGSESIAAHNIVWAAGVSPSPIAASLGVPLERGRVIVGPDLSIPGHPEVFVAGDLAMVKDLKRGKPVPGMCPGAIQMGQHLARLLKRELKSPASPPARPVFRFRDKGTLATIGRAKAVAAIGSMKFGGLIAWLLWALVHIVYLIGFRNRVIVMMEWAWSYWFFERGARLITHEHAKTPPGSPAR